MQSEMIKGPKSAMPDPSKVKAAQRREDRLKQALKANMARRKAQARERAMVNDDAPATAQDDNTGANDGDRQE